MMASRNVSRDRDRFSRRETIGIAIDLADCVVGMSPARLLLASIGALMVVDPSGSNHHLAGPGERESDGKVSPLINHGRVSKQTEMSWWDAPLPRRATLPICLMLFSGPRGQPAEMMSL